MVRTRLPGDPAFDYQVQRNNFIWPDHIERLLVTGSVIAWLRPRTVADPACGDGSVLEAAYRQSPFEFAHLSDISVPNIEGLSPSFPHEKHARPITEAVEAIDDVDVIVLTEVLEHLADPDAILRLARPRARHLVASSPVSETASAGNPEHLWSWDEDGYEEMLSAAGWTTTSLTALSWPMFPYKFQIWTAR